LFTLSLEALALFTLAAPFTLSLEGSELNEGSLEVSSSSPGAHLIFPYVREFALGLPFKTPSAFRP
jgi:hypothetical protein